MLQEELAWFYRDDDRFGNRLTAASAVLRIGTRTFASGKYSGGAAAAESRRDHFEPCGRLVSDSKWLTKSTH